MNDREIATIDLFGNSIIGTLFILYGIHSLYISYKAHKWLKEDAEFKRMMEKADSELNDKECTAK